MKLKHVCWAQLPMWFGAFSDGLHTALNLKDLTSSHCLGDQTGVGFQLTAWHTLNT